MNTLNNKYSIQGPRIETNYPLIRHTKSQDGEEIPFCACLLIDLYVFCWCVSYWAVAR